MAGHESPSLKASETIKSLCQASAHWREEGPPTVNYGRAGEAGGSESQVLS